MYICIINIHFNLKDMLPISIKKAFGKIKPQDVFTPAKAATINYVKRNELVNNIHNLVSFPFFQLFQSCGFIVFS